MEAFNWAKVNEALTKRRNSEYFKNRRKLFKVKQGGAGSRMQTKTFDRAIKKTRSALSEKEILKKAHIALQKRRVKNMRNVYHFGLGGVGRAGTYKRKFRDMR